MKTKVISSHSKPLWNPKLCALSLELREVENVENNRTMNQNITKYEFQNTFKTEPNQSFNKWIEGKLDSVNITTLHVLEKVSQWTSGSKLSKFGRVAKCTRKLASSPEENMETGKHLGNENFIQQDLNTNEIKSFLS